MCMSSHILTIHWKYFVWKRSRRFYMFAIVALFLQRIPLDVYNRLVTCAACNSRRSARFISERSLTTSHNVPFPVPWSRWMLRWISPSLTCSRKRWISSHSSLDLFLTFHMAILIRSHPVTKVIHGYFILHVTNMSHPILHTWNLFDSSSIG